MVVTNVMISPFETNNRRRAASDSKKYLEIDASKFRLMRGITAVDKTWKMERIP